MSEASASASSVRRMDLIYQPKDEDVLLGRGSFTNRHPGNERFRLLVAARKREYNASRKHPRKKVLAKEVFDAVHASGGRFLKQVEYNGPGSDGDDEEEGGWFEVEVKDALEKCKQTLREKNEPTPRPGRSTEAAGSGNINERGPFPINVVPVGGIPGGATYGLPSGFGRGGSASLTPVLPPTLAREGQAYGGVNANLSLSTIHPYMIQPSSQFHHSLGRGVSGVAPVARQSGLLGGLNQPLPPSTNLTNTFHSRTQDVTPMAIRNLLLGAMNQPLPPPTYLINTLHSRTQNVTSPAYSETIPHQQGELHRSRGQASGTASGLLLHDNVAPNQGESDRTDDSSAERHSSTEASRASDSLLSALQEADVPRFTEADAQAERASLTEAERVDALVDMFGKYCTTSPSKRVKRDLDRETVQCLINQTRLEIEQIPEIKKRALLEAQTKCDAKEFSDSRIEQFLRCADMDPKLGAQRFVNYWERRKEVFGPERYLLRMSLSEALCKEDVVALELGLYCPLPLLDRSGRQLVLFEPCRHTGEGYTLENMLRACWYVIEVLAQENNHAGSGIVEIIWDKPSTIFDYDLRLYERLIFFDSTCLPVRAISVHSCCSPGFAINTLKPIVTSWLNKWIRSRITIHTVPTSQVPNELSNYGILREMLPTWMGGTLKFSMMEWIANRRAEELEEI